MKYKYHSQPEYVHVERPSLIALKKNGWSILELPQFGQTVEQTSRESFSDCILKEHLIKALRKINVDENNTFLFDDEQIEELLNNLENLEGNSLIEKNEYFLNHYIYEDQKARDVVNDLDGAAFKIFDFENIDNNDFLAVSQFRYPSREGHALFPDITLFVNGVPLGVVECKHGQYFDSTPVLTAIQDLRNYQDLGDLSNDSEKKGNEKLFYYNQILIACDENEGQYGTVCAKEDHFLEWKTLFPIMKENEIKDGKKQNSRERLLQGMLTPSSFMDIISNFNLFKTNTDADTPYRYKVLPRYQQYRAANKIFNRIKMGENPIKKGGVVWHTQGSGKSLTMVFLIKKLRDDRELRKLKIVLVTDRTSLDEQLHATAELAKDDIEKVDKISDLKSKLSNDTSNIVMLMMQKLRPISDNDEEEEEVELETINESENVLILIDEAHRTQNSSLGVALNCAFPNAIRIAFTGTPLITSKKPTLEVFKSSSYIDEYRFNEAIADRATLPIRYERKAGKQTIKGETFDAKFEDLFRERSKEDRARIKEKYGTKGDILEAPKRINLIVKDIVDHYIANILPDGFKAQLVASSRVAAYRYNEALNLELKRKYEELKGDITVDNSIKERLAHACSRLIISSAPKKKRGKKKPEDASLTQDEGQGNKPVKEADILTERKKSLSEDSVELFKKPFDVKVKGSGTCFLVVKDMLLTGFDAPIEQVMYVDKKMIEHNLLQAIARVNRTASKKTRGYVVDYYGVTGHLKKALSIYTKKDNPDEFDDYMDNAFEDKIEQELPALVNSYQELLNLFSSDVPDFEKLVKGEIDNVDSHHRVFIDIIDLLEPVTKRAAFDAYFKQFLESLDVIMPDKACRPYLIPAKMFARIIIQAKRVYERRKDSALNGAGAKIKKLVNESLEVGDLQTKIIADIGTGDFEQELKSYGSKKSKAFSLRGAIEAYLRRLMKKNPGKYKKLSEKLKKILEQFEEDWDEQFSQMKDLENELVEPEADVVVDEFTDIFIFALFDKMKEKKVQFLEDDSNLINVVAALVAIIKVKFGELGFALFEDTHKGALKKLDGQLQDLMIDNDTLYDFKDEVASMFISIAKENLNND